MLLATAIAALALSRPHSRAVPWLALVLVSATLVGGVWRQAFVRATVPGLLAGLLPLVAPLCAMRLGSGAGLEDCTLLCIGTCLVAGGLAGFIIVRASAHVVRGRRTFLLVAGGLGTLAASLTCLQFGAVSLAVLAAGYAVSLVPGWIFTRTREDAA
jgi:hypothetical protein